MSIELLVPDPEVLIMGLRDTGYETNTALADVVDNSVDASASKISINIRLDINKQPSVVIADNGCGMTREELIDGMKYGSTSTLTKDPRRLGKFGLGLKTASTAFCRRFSVVSRRIPTDPIYMATWDLDKVAEDNEWNLEVKEENEISPTNITLFKNAVGSEGHGTVVIWEKVDRFPKTKSSIDKIAEKFSNYAALIYHRFLDPKDERARNVSIFVNGKELEPNDPFCLAEIREDGNGTITTGKAKDKECVIQMEDGTERTSYFHLQGYVLPLKNNFSSQKAFEKANITNHNMGFYVYRENRMIACGDWLGLRKAEPHTTLYRAEFSFDHNLDVAFKIDVKKSRIELNPDLSDWLKNWMAPGIKMAEDRYRRNKEKTVEKDSTDCHSEPDKNILNKEKFVDSSMVKPISDVQPDGTQKVEVTNANTPDGPCVVSIKIAPDDTPGVTIKLGEVRGDALWEPTIVDGHKSVLINPNHPFYQKVYYPNLQNGITMTGLDSLLWALANAELGTVNEYQKRDFKDFRNKVSGILEALVADLPEPEID